MHRTSDSSQAGETKRWHKKDKMKNMVAIIIAVLLSGCMSVQQNSTPQIVRPVTVTHCGAVLERSDALTFVSADDKTFELTESWYTEEPILSLSTKNYGSGRITRNMPIRTVLIECFQEYLDSQVTPAQLKAVYTRGLADYSVLSKEEKNILGAKGYIESLSRIEEKANK